MRSAPTDRPQQARRRFKRPPGYVDTGNPQKTRLRAFYGFGRSGTIDRAGGLRVQRV